MARSAVLLYSLSRRVSHSLRRFFFIPTIFALTTSLIILFYISSTSTLFIHPHLAPLQLLKSTPTSTISRPITHFPVQNFTTNSAVDAGGGRNASPWEAKIQVSYEGNYGNIKKVFHNKKFFIDSYKEMNSSLKIYIYPHSRDDPFANAFLPVDFEPGGNYASESYFKKVLTKSHLITKDPSKADLFFLPFSIARLRHDPRVGTEGIQDFVRHYIFNISHNYPYWNRTGGADHFYVACHSIGRSAMEKALFVKFNAIQVVCSASYFLAGYVAHKDACLPQIWPRKGDPPTLTTSKREKLAFFAGSINSPVREKLLEAWRNDTEISVSNGPLKTPYADGLLGSKFCLHVKGFEVNTARIADALYYGCVPVIIANYYDLPFADILNWRSFSVVVPTLDIPLLKKILKEITMEDYRLLQNNVLKVRKHFQWHIVPSDYDAFYMVMYELWLRRSAVRVPLSSW